MIKSITHYENRIARLKTSGEMRNINLIKKAERQLQRAKIYNLVSDEFEKIINDLNDMLGGKISYDDFISSITE